MSINDVYRSVATFTGRDAQVLQWVWHYVQTLTGLPSDSLLNTAIATNLTTAWLTVDQHVDDQVVGNNLELLKWDSVLNQFNGVASNDISALVGTSAVEAMPMNVAPYVTFFTALPRSRGKKFFFGVDEATVANGLLSAAFLTSIALFAAQFDATILEGAITFNPGNFNVPTEVFRQWTQATTGLGIFSGSQYRRLPGRGA